MADQIKEISNGTYSVGALTDGVAIASTNATTQNVVKDIQVNNNQLTAFGANLDFVVNGVNVADIDTSVTGSEIIDVSSTAVARTAASFSSETFQVLMPSSSANAKISTFTRKLVNGNMAYTAPVTQSAAITTSLDNGTNIEGFATVGSNFFYWVDDGNSSQALYRRVGGINGTQETVANISSYQPVVFNGVDRFYWVTTSQIRTYNATTNTHSAVNLQPPPIWSSINYSYPRISFANGLVFWTSNSNGGDATYNAVYGINPTTGGMIQINSAVGTLGIAMSTESVMEVFYSNSTYYIVSTEASGALSRDLFVRTIADFGPLTSGGISGAATPVYSGVDMYTAELTIANNWPIADKTANKLYFMSSETNPAAYSYVYKNFDPITQTFGSSINLNLSSVLPNTGSASAVKLSGYALTNDSANKLNTTFYPQSVTLRVTGVQTTP